MENKRDVFVDYATNLKDWVPLGNVRRACVRKAVREFLTAWIDDLPETVVIAVNKETNFTVNIDNLVDTSNTLRLHFARIVSPKHISYAFVRMD